MHFFLTWLLYIVAIVSVMAQNCLPDGIVFTRQSEIDSFRQLYPDCHEILGSVLIEESREGEITSLKGLGGIVRIGGYLEIRRNKSLTTLEGLGQLEYIGGRLSISGNTFLINLEGLQELHYVGESIRISSNQKLSNIRNLEGLQVVRGDLAISDTEFLSSLGGLHRVVEVEGNLIIARNYALDYLEGLDQLHEIDGDLLISENKRLKSLEGLQNLEDVSGDLIIDANSSLSSLKGLNGLQSVNGFLQLVNNQMLVDLSALSNLGSINGLLQIYNNPELETLMGLENIAAESIDNLAIIDCAKLKACHEMSICQFLDTETAQFSIRGNAFGCNSNREILDRCSDVGPSGQPRKNEIILYPNPTLGSTWVRGYVEEGTILVTDMLGKVHYNTTHSSGFYDFSPLAAGAYQIHIAGRNKNFTGLLIKQ